MSQGYEILSVDDLGAYPSQNHGDSRLMPLRQRLGLRAFGANCWTADVGKRIVPEHEEDSGNEELYAVVRGRATFTVDGETVDAPAGTLLYVLPGELRTAVAEEPGTVVLAVGATVGVPFVAQGWDDVVVAFAQAEAGEIDAARATLQPLADKGWEGVYNLACFEARFGDLDAAFEHLQRVVAAAPDETKPYLEQDSDLDRLREDPRWQELAG
jgi:mannose-6-phosphate isomerase-like protein (cupin superfamily)